MKRNGEVVATPGEIVKEERDQEFERDSATGELVGLSGSMTIEIEDGVHRYVFRYELDD